MYLPILPASTAARSITQYIPAYTPTNYLLDDNGNGSPDDPKQGMENWSSLIGIITAVVGNVLIALALNVQRYAHTQLHRERALARERARQALKNAKNGGGSRGGYGAVDEPGNGSSARGDDEADDARDTDPLAQSFQSGGSAWSENSDEDAPKPVSTYLQSPYWWLGQILITVGEMGNFLAYGFAPASIVSPLGVVALVSNCIIAPILFKETFRTRDFWGVVIAVFGAVTVVLSANTQETKLDPHAVWEAITTLAFEVYMGVTGGLIIILMWLSPKYGNRTILIDLGLVGLFGKSTDGRMSLQRSLVADEKPRRLYCSFDQGRCIHAVFYFIWSIYHASDLRALDNPTGHGHHAGPLPEQCFAEIRFDASDTHTIRHFYAMCHHRKCSTVQRLRADNGITSVQVHRRLSSDFLRCVSHY